MLLQVGRSSNIIQNTSLRSRVASFVCWGIWIVQSGIVLLLEAVGAVQRWVVLAMKQATCNVLYMISEYDIISIYHNLISYNEIYACNTTNAKWHLEGRWRLSGRGNRGFIVGLKSYMISMDIWYHIFMYAIIPMKLKYCLWFHRFMKS